jgi:hypothetical protein
MGRLGAIPFAIGQTGEPFSSKGGEGPVQNLAGIAAGTAIPQRERNGETPDAKYASRAGRYPARR